MHSVRLMPPLPVTSDAEFLGGYRYWLSRPARGAGPVGLIIGLNPSKAGAAIEDTDHTITKEIEYASRWGWSGFWKGNLFAHVETKSAKLRGMSYDAAVGPHNDDVLGAMIAAAPQVVICWGNNVPPALSARPAVVLDMVRKHHIEALCFGLTSSGAPMHPLRLSYDTKLVVYPFPAERASRR